MMIVENVCKSFGERRILHNVNLEIKEKSMMTITGKSGSGKTTLLGIISGLLNPDSGRVLYNDINIFKWLDFKRSRFRNKKIGFVFQFFNLLPDMTAYQNIVYPTLINFSFKGVKDELDYLIDFLNLREIIHQYPSTLSGGERQRVAIARAVINIPEIIIADEPTGNLDNETAQDILRLFLEIKKKYGMSLIVVTHDAEFIKYSDMQYHLHEAHLSKVSAKRKLNVASPGKNIRPRK